MKRVKLKENYRSQYLKNDINYNVWKETKNTYGLMDNDGSLIWFVKDMFKVVEDNSDYIIEELKKDIDTLRIENEKLKTVLEKISRVNPF